jgi:GWxTD domain-containing protein
LATLEQNRPITGEAVLAATGGNLMKRIDRLLDQPKRTHHAVTPALAVGVLLIITAASVAGSIHAESAPRVDDAWAFLSPASPPRLRPYVSPTLSPAPRVAAPQQEKQDPKPSDADLPKPYRKWLNEDVAYIITKSERADFLALKSDEERDHFIEEFWLRRDPTPGTPENEFKDEHYRRIGFANQHFASGIPGWKTDRGRIYIIYGPPDEITAHPKGESYQRPAEQGGGTTSTYPFEQWRYRYIEGIGDNVVLDFVDTKGNGEYRKSSDPAAR